MFFVAWIFSQSLFWEGGEEVGTDMAVKIFSPCGCIQGLYSGIRIGPMIQDISCDCKHSLWSQIFLMIPGILHGPRNSLWHSPVIPDTLCDELSDQGLLNYLCPADYKSISKPQAVAVGWRGGGRRSHLKCKLLTLSDFSSFKVLMFNVLHLDV